MRILALVILVCTGATYVLADDDKKKAETKVAKRPVIVAIAGTPKIDGEVDEEWKKAPKAKVAKPVPELQITDEKDMATAVVRLMWDKEHIYALWRVKDTVLSASADNAWDQDSVEVFLDENEKGTEFYQLDDAQYRVNFQGKLSGQGQGFKEEHLKAATKKTKDGYLIEMAIKVNDASRLKSGAKLGLELQVNDDPGDGTRGAVAKWNHIKDDSWENTSHFGTLELK